MFSSEFWSFCIIVLCRRTKKFREFRHNFSKKVCKIKLTYIYVQSCSSGPAVAGSTSRRPLLVCLWDILAHSVEFPLQTQKDYFWAPCRVSGRGGWVIVGIWFVAGNCCTVSKVWEGALSWCRNELYSYGRSRCIDVSQPVATCCTDSTQSTPGFSRKWLSQYD
jgi:hypothetical protein